MEEAVILLVKQNKPLNRRNEEAVRTSGRNEPGRGTGTISEAVPLSLELALSPRR